MDFGLGLILSFTDNATAGMNSAIASLNQLTATAEASGNSINALADTVLLSSFSTVTGQLGDTFLSMGNSIIGSIQGIFNTVSSIGSEFEGFRLTLKQFYGDDTETQIQNLMNYAKKSSYTVSDLKDMLVTLKSQGVEAFDSLTSTVSGTSQVTMDWLGDLMAFKPDILASRWKLAIQNFLGSGETKMLRNILDAGKIEQIIGHGVGDTVSERMQNLTEIVEALGLKGLQQSMSTSWTTIASNFEDAWTRIYLAVADAGVFDKLKEAMVSVYSVFTEMDDVSLQNFASSIAGGLNLIATPVVAIAKLLGKLVQGIVDFASSHPELMKLVVAFTSLAGVGLVLTGVVLKIMSAMSGVLATIYLWQSMSPMFSSLVTAGFSKILGVLLPISLAVGALAIGWKYNFLGMRDAVTNLVTNLQSSFSTAKSAIAGDVENMKTIIAGLDKDTFFGKLTLGIIKVGTLFKALCELFSGKDGYTLSEDTFLKCKELGILPLIEAILDLKYRFENFAKGFKEGLETVLSAVGTFVGGAVAFLKDVPIFEPLIEGVTNLLQALSNNDAQAWENLGTIFGQVAGAVLVAVSAIKVATTVFGAFKAICTPIVGAVKAVITAVGSAITLLKGGLLAGTGFASNLVNAFALAIGGAGTLKEAFIAIFGKVGQLFAGIGSVIAGAVLAVVNFVDMFRNGFSAVNEILMLLGIAIATVGAIILGAPAVIAGVVAGIVAIVANLVIAIKNNWEAIKTKTQEVFSTIGSIFSTVLSGILNVVTTILTAVVLFFVESWNSISSTVSSVLTGIGNFVSNGLSSIRNTFSSIGNAIKSTVSNVFNEIKSTISNVINNAKNTVSNGLNAIKGFFSNLTLKLPHIKLPHFKLSGSLSINPPSVPKLSVDWYEKGGVFNKPSVIGVGENGQEAVMPLEKNTGWIGILASKIATLITGGSASISKSLKSSIMSISSSLADTMESVSTTTALIPTNSSIDSQNGSVTNNREYLTKSNNTNTIKHGDDNSQIVFAEGSIVIKTDGSEKDAERFAEMIVEKIKRKKQIENMTNYKDYDDLELLLT